VENIEQPITKLFLMALLASRAVSQVMVDINKTHRYRWRKKNMTTMMVSIWTWCWDVANHQKSNFAWLTQSAKFFTPLEETSAYPTYGTLANEKNPDVNKPDRESFEINPSLWEDRVAMYVDQQRAHTREPSSSSICARIVCKVLAQGSKIKPA